MEKAFPEAVYMEINHKPGNLFILVYMQVIKITEPLLKMVRNNTFTKKNCLQFEVISLYTSQQTLKPLSCAYKVLHSLAAAEPLDVCIHLSAVGTSAPIQWSLAGDIGCRGNRHQL